MAIFEDNSKSAMTGTRPAFQALLAAVRAGEVDCVIVWSLTACTAASVTCWS
jgi:DNA invertase Pin-like site-specific DNA recombinase